MFVAQDGKGQLIEASRGKEGRDSHFVCPGCQQPVFLRCGRLKIAHFAHQRHCVCARATEGETQEHLVGKQALKQFFEARGYYVQLEQYFPVIKQRADLVIYKNNQVIALEFQCAALSFQQVQKRSAGYRQLGIVVLWILGERYQQRKVWTRLGRTFGFWGTGQALPHIYFWQSQRGLFSIPWQHVDNDRKVRQNRLGQTNLEQLAWRQVKALQMTQRYGRGKLRFLAVNLYQQGHCLEAIPWSAHGLAPQIGGLSEPYWSVRLQLLLLLEQRVCDWKILLKWLEHFQWLTPHLISLKRVQELWLQQVLDEWQAQQVVSCDTGKYRLQEPLIWYTDINEKLAALPAWLVSMRIKESGYYNGK
ncbi:competence protein [Weissella kandleri]|uniref:Competence protein n=1 Tax=Weissella kandleri TaxID=1616 RepID=A0A0R2JCV4_9LACO|nr:competence protein CoiA family protein [Weissella kandleri]KRN75105.1 competence protein [Weissella kandleri]